MNGKMLKIKYSFIRDSDIIVHDGVRDYCLSEKINEEYVRSLLRQECKSGGIMDNDRKEKDNKKLFLYPIIVLLLFVFQTIVGKAGCAVADALPLGKVDPDNAFAWISVHHITEMLIVLAVVMVLSRILKVDFGFTLGDRKRGIKYVAEFSAIFALVTLVCHILMKIFSMLPVYSFPLNIHNILGTLSFQLFLSGPMEEILYRALPITLILHVTRKSVKVKWGITLETIIVSFLFALAHLKWSLFPFSVEPDFFALIYAFVMGIIMGKAYQDTGSVLYPMLMHSISNVMMVGTGYLFLIF